MFEPGFWRVAGLGCRADPARSDVPGERRPTQDTRHEESTVKYVILIYSNPATWRSLPPAETERIIAVHNDLIAELTESG